MDKYIQKCLELADNSSCSKKKYGSVIVKDDKIIGEGYNHPVTKEIEDLLCHPCVRENINSGTRLEMCAAIHAEQAAIIDAYKNGKDPEGSTLYVAGKRNGESIVLKERGFYCSFCSRIMAEVGIEKVGVLTTKGVEYLTRGEYLKSSFEFAMEKKVIE